MWIRYNANPTQQEVPDCVIRAIATALGKTWLEVSDELYYGYARKRFSVTCDDHIWGRYLYDHGFQPFLLPEACPKCVTINAFTRMYPRGTYIIGTGSHAVAVIDGDYYDIWDSGNQIPTFFWRIAQ